MKKALLTFSKSVRLFGAALLIGAVSMTYTGCSSEGCTDPNANNYDEKADEDDGTCEFDRDAMIGTYSVSGAIACGVTGNGAASGLSLIVSESSVGTDKIVLNLEGTALTAVVSGSSFTIENATIDGYDYSGSGSISGNTINVVINEYDDSIPETCIFTLNGSRQ
jgi:hypothetical protein